MKGTANNVGLMELHCFDRPEKKVTAHSHRLVSSQSYLLSTIAVETLFLKWPSVKRIKSWKFRESLGVQVLGAYQTGIHDVILFPLTSEWCQSQ